MDRPLRRFWFALAAHLKMSVSQAQSCIDSAEFSEWIAMHNIEPFTENRTEKMLSIITSWLLNQSLKKGIKPFEPEDFVPEIGKKKPQSAEHLELKLRAILNGNNQ